MRKLSFIFLICILTACSDRNSMENYSSLTNLNDLQQTAFVPALESYIDDDKNIIYTPTLLFAWDEVRKLTGQPIEYSADSLSDFDVLNTSTSFWEALDKGEYETTAEVNERQIVASAYFKKFLFFEPVFQKEEPLKFNGIDVQAFGMSRYGESLAKNINVLHYRNDSLFVLSLTPKEEGHQIILAKGIDSIQSLSDALYRINQLIDEGGKGKADEITEGDILRIPAIKFDLETNYRNLEGQNFKAVGQDYKIITVKQHTQFDLNESGARVESEAMIAVASAKDSIMDLPKPKNLIFDKPFIIIMKHRDRKNPYFVARIANDELLVKEVN